MDRQPAAYSRLAMFRHLPIRTSAVIFSLGSLFLAAHALAAPPGPLPVKEVDSATEVALSQRLLAQKDIRGIGLLACSQFCRFGPLTLLGFGGLRRERLLFIGLSRVASLLGALPLLLRIRL